MRYVPCLGLCLLLASACTPASGTGAPGGVSFDRAAVFEVQTQGPIRRYFVGPGPGGNLHSRRDLLGALAVDRKGEQLLRPSADAVEIVDFEGHRQIIPVVPPPGVVGTYEVMHGGLSAAYAVLLVWPHENVCTFVVYDRAKKTWAQGTVTGTCPYIRYVPPTPGPIVVGGAGTSLSLVWPGSDKAVPVTGLTRFIGTDATGRTYGSNDEGSVVRFGEAGPTAALTETAVAPGPLVAPGYDLRFIGIGGGRVYVSSGSNLAQDPPLRSYRLDGTGGRDEVLVETATDAFGALPTSVSPDGHLLTFTHATSTGSFNASNFVYDTRTRGIATLGGGVADTVYWLDPGVKIP